MSYRIKVNGEPIFGNNEYPKAFLKLMSELGVDMDEDGCFEHIFEAGELPIMKVVDAIEDYVADIMKKHRDSIWEFTYWEEALTKTEGDEDEYPTSIFDAAASIVECGYIFTPYKFIQAIKDQIRFTKSYQDRKHNRCYEQTGRIRISAR